MTITATIHNSNQVNKVEVATNEQAKQLTIPAKTVGQGAAVNGGELLFLALATCYCKDVYREAAKRNLVIDSVEVTVSGEFGAEGEPASNIMYQVNVQSAHAQQEITDLIKYVDRIAEVHNTLRKGLPVTLKM